MAELDHIRNFSIIAHIDHGKSTIADRFIQSCGGLSEREMEAQVLDSMDLERERGITIASKNGTYIYGDYHINIIDTPGHADFGGQVERVLRMADGAVLLVDAQEGPMPQTFFVVKKALAANLPILVVINKIDKPAARCDWAVDQVFDLLGRLGAPDATLDFPVVYASSKAGYALNDPSEPVTPQTGMRAVSEMIVRHVQPPAGSPDAPLQLQINTIDYSPYLGRLGIGRIVNGRLDLTARSPRTWLPWFTAATRARCWWSATGWPTARRWPTCLWPTVWPRPCSPASRPRTSGCRWSRRCRPAGCRCWSPPCS